MTIESDADRLGMLEDFGIAAVINGTINVTGIFDDKFKMVDELGQEIESALPQLLCRSTDVAAVTDGMTCVVNGTNYVVRTVEPDGTGFARLILHK